MQRVQVKKGAEEKNKDLLDGFKRWMEAQEASSRTVKSYREKARKLLVYLRRHKVELAAVDSSAVDLYMQYLLINKKQARNTRAQTRYALKRFFAYLVERGEASANPVDKSKPIKKEKRVAGSLTNEEITLMIHAPGVDTELGLRDTAIIAMLASVGARATALCNLRMGDIRIEEVRIPPRCTHCGQVDYSGGSKLRGRKKKIPIVKLREKGGKEWDVPLNDKAAFYLNQYLVQRVHGRDSDVIFPRYRRQPIAPITRHGLRELIRKYAARAGVKGSVSPHSFRRAVITWLMDCGVDEMVVKNFVGHAWLSTTEIYRAVTHRSFAWAGVAEEKSLLEAIETPMDGLMDRLPR